MAGELNTKDAKGVRTEDLWWNGSGVLTIENKVLAKAVEAYVKAGGVLNVHLHETEPVDLLCGLVPYPYPPIPPIPALTLRIEDKSLGEALSKYFGYKDGDKLKIKAGSVIYPPTPKESKK